MSKNLLNKISSSLSSLLLGEKVDDRSYTFTQKNNMAMHERETLSDFLNVEEFVYAPKEKFGIFYCQNGYRGYSIEISAPAKATISLHDDFLSLLGQSMPTESVIQVTFLPSRNIQNIVENYRQGHLSPHNLGRPENVINLVNSNADWILRNINDSLLDEESHVQMRPRNLRVMVTFMIPELDDNKRYITDREIAKYAIKSKSRLKSFFPNIVDHNTLLTFMNEILRPNISDMSSWTVKERCTENLNTQLVSSSDKVDKYIGRSNYFKISNKQSEETYATVLTPKSFPSYMHIGKMNEILFDEKGTEPKNHLNDPFIITLTIVFVDKKKKETRIKTKAQGNIYQARVAKDKVDYFPSLEARTSESKHILKQFENNEMILSSQWSLTMFAPTEEKLSSNVEAIMKDSETIGLFLQEESELGFEMFLGSLPFGFDYGMMTLSKRYDTMLKQNNAVINPIYGDTMGMGRPSLGIPYFGRKNQLLFFDNFDGTHAGNNIIVSAPTRSGKTFFAMNYISQLAAKGGRAFFIELQETVDGVTDAFGGKYIRFDEHRKICLNFFSDIRTNEEKEGKLTIHRDAMITIIPLIGLMLNKKLVSSEEDSAKDNDAAIFTSYIERAVNAAFLHKQFDCGMSDVYEELLKISTALNNLNKRDTRLEDALVSLDPYAKKVGVYYDYFNGKKTENFSDSSLTGIGLASLQQKGDLFSIVLMALTQSITNEFFKPENAHIPKALIVDEAWAILKNPIFASFIVRIFRTLNKFNGAGVSISQDIEQYFTNKDLEALYNNATYKIFFKQKKDAIDRLVAEKKLPSNELFIEDLKSLKTLRGEYAEIMIYTEDGYSLGRIISNKYAFYLYSNQDGAPEVFELMKILNCTKHEASWILNYIDENKINKEYERNSPIPIKIGVEVYKYKNNLAQKDDLSEETLKYVA